MADVTPSLGELSNAAQSQQAIPVIAPKDSTEVIRTLNHAAQVRAQYDWAKLLNFQKQLGDTLADVNKVQELDVSPEDKPELLKDRAELLQTIAKNPEAFSGRDPAKYAEIQSLYGNLMGKATESKSFNAYDKGMRGYVAQNPELNTDENKAIIEGARKKPLGENRLYNLTLNPVFDANAFTIKLMTQATEGPTNKSYPVDFDKQGQEIIGDKYIRQIAETRVSFPKFIKDWNTALYMQDDKNGQPIKKFAEKKYNELPTDIKKNFTLEEFWNRYGEESFGGTRDQKGIMQDIIKKEAGELKPNSNYVNPQELAIKKGHLAVDWANYNRLAKGVKVAEEVAKSASSYATTLYEKLNSLKDANGFIPKEKLTSLTSDELKYLGTATTTDNKFSLSPLNGDRLTKLKINDDGTISVFENVSSGTGAAKVITEVQRPNIEVKTIAINKLGDEMTQATGKEGINFNDLIPLYKSGTEKPKTAAKSYTVGSKTLTSDQIVKGAAKYKMTVEEYVNSIGAKEQ